VPKARHRFCFDMVTRSWFKLYPRRDFVASLSKALYAWWFRASSKLIRRKLKNGSEKLVIGNF